MDFLSHLKIGRNEVSDICESSIMGEETVMSLARELHAANLIGLDDGALTIGAGGRVRIGCYFLGKGASLEELGRVLDWREFEDLVSKSLEAQRFTTWKNFRMRKPTREIDVVGLYSGFAIAFDCKHWQRVSSYSLSLAADKQVQRVRQLVASEAIPGIEEALPALVVLGPLHRASVHGVPVVHSDGLMDFIAGARGSTRDFVSITASKRGAGSSHGQRRL